jgi:branched-subunit amino acid aminotransferase/4-amino-4-deoxychorismate lyase
VTLLALAVSGRGVVEPDEPAVFADDEAFLRGRGAFETVRVYGGRPFRLGEHLARLEESARRLGLPAVAPREIESLAAEAIVAAGRDDAFIRIYATPGREGRGQPFALVLVAELPAELEQTRARGIGLITVPLGLDSPGLLGGVKSTSYAVNMVAIDEAKRRGADDAVFLGTGGVVLEGPTTNVWWRRGDTLYSPALELGILEGVTRGVVLELAPELGYRVEEGTHPVSALAAADEAFTSSSVRELMPAVALDGEAIGDGRPGAAARELQAGLRRLAQPSGAPTEAASAR